ncbi:uncharacterized protein LOC126213079 [Schistocerca nitens]|uniref:uncharacterized protein LOC126213079 n=1 Tax=Schistocerca nitens TaxID=7011 RepID=UPI002117D020|nr:uncharacterized protein LOC126213079 [Schistocerca nitens]
MGLTYKRKEGVKARKKIDSRNMELAVMACLGGKSFRGASKEFQVPLMTLKRYVRKQLSQDTEISYSSTYNKSQVVSTEEENSLCEYLKTASKLHHGLSAKSVRAFAYQFSSENKKKIPENWKKEGKAGNDWFRGFMRRHPELSLRTPEGTSISRGSSFNKHNVRQFFDNLRQIITREVLGPESIWNIDETGLTTVHKPGKIVAVRGEKQVGKVTSAERGELVTACCAINAIGGHIPPFMIFPRVNWQDRMLHGAPPGTSGSTHSSSWMTADNFVLFLKHFHKYVKCSAQHKALIIMDNHDSHISLESLHFAKENGITLLTIPPHTSHKIQPLDRSVYGPLKAYYNSAAGDWMTAHPGKTISIYDISEIFGRAFPKAFTPSNVISGFRVSGIWPFNSDIFTDDEFLSVYTTDHLQSVEVCDSPKEFVSLSTPSSSGIRPSAIGYRSFEDIRPHPKAAAHTTTRRGRKRACTAILTNTPVKDKLEAELRARKARRLKPVGRPKRLNFENKKQTYKPKVETSESEELSPCEFDNDLESLSNSDSDEILNNEPGTGKWIIATFQTKKSEKHYVGEIVNVPDEENFTIKCVRKIEGQRFKWPETEDICDIERNQIVRVIPTPAFSSKNDRVTSFIFNSVKFEGFNIQ